jgi:hypothetical protein
MKKLVVIAAVALAGFTVSAAACDWNREASSTPTVVADGSPQNQTVTEQDSSKAAQPTQDQAKDESWPILTVAECQGHGCK